MPTVIFEVSENEEVEVEGRALGGGPARDVLVRVDDLGDGRVHLEELALERAARASVRGDRAAGGAYGRPRSDSRAASHSARCSWIM